jgi:diguanylate cyclase (GGDEF)-like protein
MLSQNRLTEVLRNHRIRPVYLLIALAAVALQVALIRVDTIDLIYNYSRSHESYEVDEIFTIFMVATLALAAVLLVRERDLRHEIGRRVEAEATAALLARHDALTGLPNRRLFQEEFSRRIEAARSSGGAVALLMLDLDRFKTVNDTYGHGIGDRLLQAVADRLAGTVRPQDFVARLGGDEFAVLIGGDGVAEGALFRVAQRILTVIAEPFAGDAWRAETTVSIGIAVFPGDGDDFEVLMQRADAAMYQAKSAGRNTYAVFDETLGRIMRERLEVEAQLREAIRRHEIVPFYQPLIDLATMRPIALEALARWNHPTRGRLDAKAFISVAEDAGLLGEIFMAVLRQVCEDCRRWGADITVAVNVSPIQFRDPRLAEKILAVLDEYHLPASRLEIEITEGALVADFESTKRTLESLKARGVSIALDDFGTGYSSLRHLHELPFDKVKIDQSFVRRLNADEESRKIVASTIGLCRALGLVTVAEGIETRHEADWVREHGGDLGQGYLFSEPVAAEAIARLLGDAAAPG